MKIHVSILSGCTVLLSMAVSGKASDPIFVGGVGSTIVHARPEITGELRARWLKDTIDLTTEQTDKIAILFINEKVELNALGYVPPHGAVAAVRQRYLEQVRALLTPGQRAKFNLIAQKFGGGRIGRSPWDLVDRLDKLVHLTPAQKSAALDVFIVGTELVTENDGPEQAAMARKIRLAMKDDIRGLLTPDQQKIWDTQPRKNQAKSSET